MAGDNYTVNTNGPSFEWDERKNLGNWRKHGIAFQEAKAAFYDEDALLMDDPDHSAEEDRFVLIGLGAKLTLLVICHAYREDGQMIRIISARRASRREEKQYWERRPK